jgi:hypothetical protein
MVRLRSRSGIRTDKESGQLRRTLFAHPSRQTHRLSFVSPLTQRAGLAVCIICSRQTLTANPASRFRSPFVCPSGTPWRFQTSNNPHRTICLSSTLFKSSTVNLISDFSTAFALPSALNLDQLQSSLSPFQIGTNNELPTGRPLSGNRNR